MLQSALQNKELIENGQLEKVPAKTYDTYQLYKKKMNKKKKKKLKEMN